MQDFNYHTHTRRCRHAENDFTDEQYVQEFIKKGIKKIAFTDHCPEKEVIDPSPKMRMDYSEKDEYLESIKYLKEKYKNQIEIQTGFEVEYLPGQEDNLFELKNETDLIVLGQHFVYKDELQKELVKHRKEHFTDEQLLRYADYIDKALEIGLPDIIAHPDIYMYGRDSFGKIEKIVAHKICKSAEKYKVPLEINLAELPGYDMGILQKVSYPCREFWKIASSYNIKVLYGIDAHYRIEIRQFEKSIDMANNIIGRDVIKRLKFIDKDFKVIEREERESYV